MDEIIRYVQSPVMWVSIAVILVALLIWRLLKRFRDHLAKAQAALPKGRSAGVLQTAFSAVKYLLMFITILTVLQINGVNVSSMIASLGVVSAIVGLALQDLLKDVIMGAHILTDHFFKVGDVVRYGGIEGEVISFGAKSTQIRNIVDGSVLSVCNRNISEIAVIGNGNGIDVPLSYEADPAQVHRVLGMLTERIAQLPDVESAVYKGTSSFEDSSILYKIIFFCHPARRMDTRRAALMVIQDGLREAGLEIPFNQLDIALKDGGAPAVKGRHQG